MEAVDIDIPPDPHKEHQNTVTLSFLLSDRNFIPWDVVHTERHMIMLECNHNGYYTLRVEGSDLNVEDLFVKCALDNMHYSFTWKPWPWLFYPRKFEGSIVKEDSYVMLLADPDSPLQMDAVLEVYPEKRSFIVIVRVNPGGWMPLVFLPRYRNDLIDYLHEKLK
jgi:hypothetical protein